MPRALDAADDVKAPVLGGRRLVAQALERNADLDLVPEVGQMSLRVEDEIGAEVCRRAPAGHAAEPGARSISPFHESAVHLDAERVDAEHARLPAVVERGEEELDPVVVVHPIAIPERRAHAAGGRMGAHAEMDRRRGIPDAGVRLGWRRAPAMPGT